MTPNIEGSCSDSKMNLAPHNIKYWGTSYNPAWDSQQITVLSLKSVYGEIFLPNVSASKVWTSEIINYDSYQEWDFWNVPKPLKLVFFSPSPITSFPIEIKECIKYNL